jgi:hypothetical protein
MKQEHSVRKKVIVSSCFEFRCRVLREVVVWWLKGLCRRKYFQINQIREKRGSTCSLHFLWETGQVRTSSRLMHKNVGLAKAINLFTWALYAVQLVIFFFILFIFLVVCPRKIYDPFSSREKKSTFLLKLHFSCFV